jgi:hypothetical protein
MPNPRADKASPAALPRRGFLKVGAVAAVLLAGGGAIFALAGRGYRGLLPPSAKPVVLSEKELAILAAVADRLVPDAPGRLSARDARVAERIDRELAFHAPKMQRDVKAALLLVEHGGLLHLSASRFTSLSADEQDAHLERMASGNELERAAFSGLRTVAMFFYYCDERTWPTIHYAGPLMPRKKPEADSRVGDDEA